MPDTQTLEEDIVLEIQIDPGPSPTTQDGISEEDHSTPSSLTDTKTSLSSSDNDHSSRIEYGISIGRRTSSSEVIPRPTTEVSESEAAKEMVKNALLCKPGGEDVIDKYEAEKSLTHCTRRQLVNILASHMTWRHGMENQQQSQARYDAREATETARHLLSLISRAMLNESQGHGHGQGQGQSQRLSVQTEMARSFPGFFRGKKRALPRGQMPTAKAVKIWKPFDVSFFYLDLMWK
ncbi:uncharacterized protein [Pagrus major]|uniref:uncharacterized protein n=1 Tax=Pagrus major TaxID=143350 RepID=UPI003CC87308